jgi:hypothetical protein
MNKLPNSLNRQEVIDHVKNGRTVTLILDAADVVSIKWEPRPVGRYTVASIGKIVVKHPELGAIYFGTFSSKFDNVRKGDKISLKVMISGVGDVSERYPDPILFAKACTKRGDSVTVLPPVADDSDLPVNV